VNDSPGFGGFLADKFDALVSPDGAFQLGVIVLCGLGAWLLKRAVSRRMRLRAREPGEDRRRDALDTAAEHLLFPGAALALLLAARGIVSRMQSVAQWLDTALVLLAAWLVIRFARFALLRSGAAATTARSWIAVIGTTTWIVVALHLAGWLGDILNWLDQVAFAYGETRFSLLMLFRLAVSVVVLLLGALWLARFVEHKLERSQRFEVGTRIGLAKFTRFTLLALAILSSLRMAGIDLTGLAVFGGALGVGLGFGLQRIASNLVSGIILVFDRSIRPGDVVTIGDNIGEVKALRARYVVVRSRDGVETLIPNETLITTNVINWTYSDRRVRVKIPVQISYADDPGLAMGIMLDAARASPRVMREPAPACLLTAFADNGINLELRVWINDPEEGISSVRSEIYLTVWREFNNHNVTIPFPQRDVYIKSNPAPIQ
jgi:small-conductance mechanosensitive channel